MGYDVARSKKPKVTPVTFYETEGDVEEKILCYPKHRRITPKLGRDLNAIKLGAVTQEMVERVLKGEEVDMPKPALVLHLEALLIDTDLIEDGKPIPPTADALMEVPTHVLQAYYDEIVLTTVPQKKSSKISENGTSAADDADDGRAG